MTSIFFHADGTATRYPTSYGDAKRLRKTKYDDGVTCPDCLSCTIKYTRTSECIHCARLSAIAFFNSATAGHPFPEDYTITENMRIAAEVLPDVPGVYAPAAPDKAIARGFSYWIRPEACSRAGHIGMQTVTGECWFCRRERERKSPRQEALADGKRWYVPDMPCLHCGSRAQRRVDNGQCSGCMTCETGERLSPRQRAIEAGERWYTPDAPCRRCGAYAQRRVDNGQCAACKPPKESATSPRQRAIEAGERWYTPDTPCRRCGTYAQRRVDNGQCAACQPPQSTEPSLAQRIMEQAPDMIMSRADAKAAGMPVYRTGRRCRRGHIAFRYLSTGACIQCMREDKGQA